MKITPIIKGEVKDGRLILPAPEFEKHIKHLLSLKGEVEFIVKKKFQKRSLPANGYFHGVVVKMIAEETGMEPAEVKAFLKAKFLSKEVVIAGKDNQWETAVIVGRTSKADVEMFGIFLEKCVAWASMFLGLIIPPPDPKHADYKDLLIEED